MTSQHTLLDLTAPTLTTDQLRLAIIRAKDDALGGVCVLPGRAQTVRLMTARSGLKVRTLVGYPTGVHAASVKGLEARLALQEGVDDIAVTPNVGYFLGGQIDELHKELAYVAKAVREVDPQKARTAAVLIHADLLSSDQTAAFALAALEGGLRGLHLHYAAPPTPDQVADLLRRLSGLSTTAGLVIHLPAGSGDAQAFLLEGVNYVVTTPA